MQRIETLILKIQELAKKSEPHAIDVALMIDYTKVLYSDLLDCEAKLKSSFVTNVSIENSQSIPQLPIPNFINNSVESAAQPIVNSTSSENPLKTFSDIRANIGLNDRYLFISEVFNDNKNLYEEILNKANQTASETEWKAWWEREIVPFFGWRNDDEAVQYFLNTVTDYFLTR